MPRRALGTYEETVKRPLSCQPWLASGRLSASPSPASAKERGQVTGQVSSGFQVLRTGCNLPGPLALPAAVPLVGGRERATWRPCFWPKVWAADEGWSQDPGM